MTSRLKAIHRDIALLIAFFFFISMAAVQAKEAEIDGDKILITIILKHQQSRNLTELQEKMDTQKFWQSFPPEFSEIDSWYVVMGLGQVITVKIHPKDLRKLNLVIEKSAWGMFDTNIYPTYEFEAIAKKIKASKMIQK